MAAVSDLVRVGRYDVEIAEYGSGEPLLYLHGHFGPPAGDSRFMAALSANRRVIVPSHPGFGRSSEDIAIHSIHDVVVFYQELLDVLGLQSVDVVAHSLGAMFAAELAAVSGDRVQRLVLVAPLGLWLDESPIPDFLPSGGPALMRMLYADPAKASPPPASTATPEEAEDAARHVQNVAAATNYLWPLPDRGLKRRIHRISASTLLLWGDADAVVSARYHDAFESAIRGSRSEVLADAGHMLVEEQPTNAAEAIAQFLD